jgi:hypothetical protein
MVRVRKRRKNRAILAQKISSKNKRGKKPIRQASIALQRDSHLVGADDFPVAGSTLLRRKRNWNC